MTTISKSDNVQYDKEYCYIAYDMYGLLVVAYVSFLATTFYITNIDEMIVTELAEPVRRNGGVPPRASSRHPRGVLPRGNVW